MKITTEWLREQGACEDQVALFGSLYPQGVELTRISLLAAAEQGLHVDWLIGHVQLSRRLLAKYQRQVAPLRAEYERQVATLLAEYRRQVVPLLAEYQRHSTPLRVEYERQVATLRVEYERQVAPLRAEYLRQVAPLLADALELP